MIRIVVIGVLLVCSVFSISYIGAQSASVGNTEIAVLVRGPVESMSFPLIYPNAMEFWTGYYRYMETEIIVSFIRRDILLPNEWESLSCNNIKGFSPDNESFFYKDQEWSVLFQFSKGVSVDCVFINTFITRLKYFLRDASPLAPPLLPAILEIR